MTATIQTSNLTKQYPGTTTPALDALTLQVMPGEIYGYLGANGAGKSTTIRLLLNFIQPSSGSATINGLDVVHDSVVIKRTVGYLAGDVALYSKSTGRELLHYLFDLQAAKDRTYLDTLVKQFEAEVDKPLGNLSKGNRQKIGVIQALMHQPDVLILDEPTSGLDPLMQEVFYDCLREARSRGTATLMSSHNLDEAQRICDRVGIIKHGKLIREQSLAGDTSLQAITFTVRFNQDYRLPHLQQEKALHLMQQVDPATWVLQPTGAINEALKALGRYPVKDIQTQQVSLEDEFMSFYGDKHV